MRLRGTPILSLLSSGLFKQITIFIRIRFSRIIEKAIFLTFAAITEKVSSSSTSHLFHVNWHWDVQCVPLFAKKLSHRSLALRQAWIGCCSSGVCPLSMIVQWLIFKSEEQCVLCVSCVCATNKPTSLPSTYFLLTQKHQLLLCSFSFFQVCVCHVRHVQCVVASLRLRLHYCNCWQIFAFSSPRPPVGLHKYQILGWKESKRKEGMHTHTHRDNLLNGNGNFCILRETKLSL